MLNKFRLGLVTTILLCLSLYAQTIQGGEYQQQIDRLLRWILKNSDSKTGLPYSHVGDKRFKDWCITYDAAVTSLAYIATGNIERAKRIIDFHRRNQGIWRLGGIIGAVDASHPTGQGLSWIVWTGENLWMSIASFHLYKATEEKRYLDFSKRLADFVISLQNNNKRSLNYGGIPLGPKGNPNFVGDQHLNYDINQPSFHEVFATEHNIDAYALFDMLYQETGEERYREAKEKVLAWLRRVAYNRKEHRFNRGCRKEVVDIAVATDVHSWGVSALGVDILDRFEIGSAQMLIEFIEKNCLVEVTYIKPTGEEVIAKGVDFVDHKTARELGRKPMVSPEWTFQLINAYKRLVNDFAKRGQKEKVALYNQKRLTLIESMLNLAVEDKGGLAYPYATEPEAPMGHGYNTPSKGNLSIIGGAYAILSLLEYDPLILKESSTQ
jgi:hypothetical protein